MGCRFDLAVAKYWESIVEKLKSDGWEMRWTEAMHDGVSDWTATATRGRERHSIHANDITLAFQELEASCSRNVTRHEPTRRRVSGKHRLRL